MNRLCRWIIKWWWRIKPRFDKKGDRSMDDYITRGEFEARMKLLEEKIDNLNKLIEETGNEPPMPMDR